MSKTINNLIPGIKTAPENYSAMNRMLWSLIALFIFFIMSSVPVYILGGIQQSQGDPFEFLRAIQASTRGTLVALGILPLITGWLLLYLVKHGQLETESPIEHQTNVNLYKLFALISTPLLASGLILGGDFGQALGTETIILIVLQLTVSTGILIYLDEMIRKGWGYGSGLSLFIAGNIAVQLIWNSFSFDPAIHAGLNEPLGAITAFFTILFNEGPLVALGQIFLRPQLPTNSLLAILFTGVIFILVVYNYRNTAGTNILEDDKETQTLTAPVKKISLDLINNTGVASVIIVFSIMAIISMISQVLLNTMGDTNILVTLLGTFATNANGQIEPAGGLVKFLTPPRGLYGVGALIPLDSSLLFDTFLRAVVYLGIVLLLAFYVDRRLGRNYNQSLTNSSSQSSVPFFDRPTIRLILLAAFADILGVIGTGVGFVLMIAIFYQILQEYDVRYNLARHNSNADV